MGANLTREKFVVNCEVPFNINMQIIIVIIM